VLAKEMFNMDKVYKRKEKEEKWKTSVENKQHKKSDESILLV
jgi:hypothetical protein